MNKSSQCFLCPRECSFHEGSQTSGYCKSGGWAGIASVCLHRGEEPPLNGNTGICNVFFAHCNLHCIFCQNYRISRNTVIFQEISYTEAVSKIFNILDKGCSHLGFVSPSHTVVGMKEIIYAVRKRYNRKIIVVYNSNAYDKVETLSQLENLVDVYLPDFKYADDVVAKKYSDADNYTFTALNAVKEMVRQKGNLLYTDDDGLAVTGVIVRHLVLPGHVDNSVDVLNLIASEISIEVPLSIMSQYNPVPAVANHPELARYITEIEYNQVLSEMEKLGFSNGWIQEFGSPSNYIPDFTKDNPFEL